MIDVAIIGGGFSGALVAVHLLRADTGLRLALIERQGSPGRGVAYGTEVASHRLNVPAARMSADPDDAEGLLRWLATQDDGPVAPGAFIPRGRYGAYVQALLASAEAEATHTTLIRHPDEAVALRPHGGGYTLALAGGDTLTARRVVLATGNFAPADPWAGRGLAHHPAYVPWPWAPGAIASIDPDSVVLLVGSGLTAIDQVLTLVESGHRGPLHMLSRGGRLPQVHAPAPALSLAPPEGAGGSVSALLRWVRAEIQQADNWRSVIDGLRPHTQRLWQGLSLEERRRFLRHVRPLWEVHRHRAAPEIMAAVEALRESGRLQLHAGRLLAAEPVGTGLAVRWRRRGSDESTTLTVGAMINCTGPEADFRKLRHPLVLSLLEQGLAQPDPLGMGLVADATGALLDAAGVASQGLYTLGPPLKGQLWETTAVPELRVQAKALASRLVGP